MISKENFVCYLKKKLDFSANPNKREYQNLIL